MAFLIPEAMTVADILAPLVEEGVVMGAAEAAEVMQTPYEYVRYLGSNPYVQGLSAAGLLEWEDLKKGAHWLYMHEYTKAPSKYEFAYSNVLSGGSPVRPTKLDDKFEEENSTQEMKQSAIFPIVRTDDKIVVPDYGNMSDLTDEEYNYIPDMNTPSKWRTKAIVCRHYTKGSNAPGVKPIILSGYRSQELETEPGKMNWNTSFSWYSINELGYCHRAATDNLNVQRGTGFTYLSGQGNTLAMPAETRQEQYSIYEMYHKKEYIITNTSNANVSVILRVLTTKRDHSNILGGAGASGDIYNTTFERDRGASANIRWSSDTDTVLTTPLEVWDYRFNLFKHRYKVRRNWREIGHRKVNLEPGHTVTIPYIDKGPRVLSLQYVNEADGDTQLSGYFKQVWIELRGTDIGWNNAAGNYQVGTGGASISIIEKSTISLKAVPQMRTRKMFFNATAPTNNSVQAATYYNQALIAQGNFESRENEDDQGQKAMDLGGN